MLDCSGNSAAVAATVDVHVGDVDARVHKISALLESPCDQVVRQRAATGVAMGGGTGGGLPLGVLIGVVAGAVVVTALLVLLLLFARSGGDCA